MFRIARAATADEMPLAANLESTLGVVPASERLAGRGLWASYSAEKLCVVFTDAIDVGHYAVACGSRSDAHGIVGWTSPSPSAARAAGVSSEAVQLFALVPDGVKSVTYDLGDGESRTVSPVGNAVSVTLPSAPLAARAATAQGVTTQSFAEAQR